MPVTALSTLDKIRIKVRRLTRSLSTAQLTDAQLDEYINTFVLYDFPEHLRLFNLYETFEFFTQPFIDVYKTSTVLTNPMYDFKNRKITVHPPIYIAGNQSQFVESREQFYKLYPMVNQIASIGQTGTGLPLDTSFTGVINSQQSNVPSSYNQNITLIRENVLFSSIDSNGNGLAMIDYPISATIGNLYVPGGAPASTVVKDIDNYINYVTGQFKVTFVAAPGAGLAINSQTIPVQVSRPVTVLFFDGQFTLRPVPDQPYRISMEVYVQPTEFLANPGSQVPKLDEWAGYIAYGAGLKIFQDRMDTESIAQIMPEFKKQEVLIQRRTIVQMTSQKVATIFDNQNLNRGNSNNRF
jgi:hypothetical protein